MEVGLNSFLFQGKLMHSRRAEVNHHFVYSVFMVLLDLDDLPFMDAHIPGFGYNRRALTAIYDQDHLPDPEGKRVPLKQMVIAHYAQAGIELGENPKIYMLTNPRMFGYVFNPITVYYAYRPSGEFVGILAEVNNTHGEQHPYVMHPGTEIPLKRAEESQFNMRRYFAPKVFYVSPFIPQNAAYEMSITPVGEKMIVHLDEYWDDKRQFQARLWGTLRPLTKDSLRGAILRYPLMTLKVIGAIHWEGLKLLRKKVPYRPWRGWRERKDEAHVQP